MSISPAALQDSLMGSFRDDLAGGKQTYDFTNATLEVGTGERSITVSLENQRGSKDEVRYFPDHFRNARLENIALDAKGIWTFDAVSGNERFIGVRTVEPVDMLYALMKHLGVTETLKHRELFIRTDASGVAKEGSKLVINIAQNRSWSQNNAFITTIVFQPHYECWNHPTFDEMIAAIKARNLTFAPALTFDGFDKLNAADKAQTIKALTMLGIAPLE